MNEEGPNYLTGSDVAEFLSVMYCHDPCRICGEEITPKNIRTKNLVFAGYSLGGTSCSAHKTCWDKNLPKESWAYPEDDTD